jgi:hypothetical protein
MPGECQDLKHVGQTAGSGSAANANATVPEPSLFDPSLGRILAASMLPNGALGLKSWGIPVMELSDGVQGSRHRAF